MKKLFSFLIAIAAIFTICLSSLYVPATSSYAWAEDLPETNFYTRSSKKIDLNNANVYAFRSIRGMYPNLAKKIVANAPYDKVDDVLNIADLSETQKQTLKDNMDQFDVRQPDPSLNRERINNSSYRL
ncbi:photosystem II oxygen evolving complex protein PsbU [Thalassoporum mexicanum PCC 7367]|uniref:photosystem II complex extrinsic protein PsbU n=1 Tax=Thalassoporum mexicanum TaxID=3457544 RepID=UPI00029FC602|nr:photosystem II complex extrinsic protein PsbU [Pseudanabaena sp. PCC 7367]AFY71346.1 photosystem II oxygen evolving complex protein PsbU [Pseudanabaena sp. PCC 7367]